MKKLEIYSKLNYEQSKKRKKSKLLLIFQIHLMLEINGQNVNKKLEIKLHEDQALYFLQLKLYNGDSSFPLKLMLNFLFNILFHVMKITMDMKVDKLLYLGFFIQKW